MCLIRYYLGDEVDDREVSGAYGTYWGEDTWFWWRYLKELDLLEDIGIKERTVINSILKGYSVECLERICLAQDRDKWQAVVNAIINPLYYITYEGTRWRSWLRHCATSWKVTGSIPDGVTGIFH